MERRAEITFSVAFLITHQRSLSPSWPIPAERPPGLIPIPPAAPMSWDGGNYSVEKAEARNCPKTLRHPQAELAQGLRDPWLQRVWLHRPWFLDVLGFSWLPLCIEVLDDGQADRRPPWAPPESKDLLLQGWTWAVLDATVHGVWGHIAQKRQLRQQQLMARGYPGHGPVMSW